ncbi:hypothetical protein [Thiomicrorhabdus indica]|uniref:hypothetical protein n=1 Tax=Thiomicrorhabdus indica TaxID=2267253 RepID=UPI00102E0271|nr:hypothetical protein [Thiomicrorhabdus indica]
MAYLKKYLHIDEVVKVLSVHDPLICSPEDVKHLIEEGELEVKVRISECQLIPNQKNFSFGTSDKKFLKAIIRKRYEKLKQYLASKDSEQFRGTVKNYLKQYSEFRRYFRKSRNMIIPKLGIDNENMEIAHINNVSHVKLSLFGRGFDDGYKIKNHEHWESIINKTKDLMVLEVDYPILVRPMDFTNVLSDSKYDLEFLKVENLKPKDGVTLFGGGYYLCEYLGMKFLAVKNTGLRFCPLEGDRDILPNAILDGELYISTYSLMKFEQRRLGIDHGLDLRSNLEKSLEKHGASKIITLEEAQKEQEPTGKRLNSYQSFIKSLCDYHGIDLAEFTGKQLAIHPDEGKGFSISENTVLKILKELKEN